MKALTFALLSAAAVAIAGCSGNQEPLGQGFGDSVRHNMAVHIINPRPNHDVNSLSGLTGPRAAGAIHRYQIDKVEELRIEKTSRKSSTK